MVRQTFEQKVALPGEGRSSRHSTRRYRSGCFVLDVINSFAPRSPVRIEKLVKSLRIDGASQKTGIGVVELCLRSSILFRSANP